MDGWIDVEEKEAWYIVERAEKEREDCTRATMKVKERDGQMDGWMDRWMDGWIDVEEKEAWYIVESREGEGRSYTSHNESRERETERWGETERQRQKVREGGNEGDRER